MLFRHALSSLLLLAIGVLPGFGQARSNSRPTFSIDGYVRDDSDQHAMENIRVDLKQSAGIPVNTTFTRGNGEFEFSNLPNGEYVIEINLKDYEPLQQTVSIFNATRRGLSLSLARPMKVVNLNSGASISAHQLSAPHKAHDAFDKGMNLLYGKSDYRGAIAQFQRAIKDFPRYYEAYAEEGSAYLRMGEMAPAEEAIRKSVDLSSGQYSEALFLLSGLLTDTNRYSEAVTFARKATEVDAASWRGPFELARALSGLKQTDEAEKNAVQARDMNPDNPPVYLMLANIHIHRRDYQALLKDLDSYLKLEPTGPDADQARKLRDYLQASRQQAENQARADAQERPHLDAQDRPIVNAASPAPEKEQPPPPEPDSSGLPPLPPPAPSNP